MVTMITGTTLNEYIHNICIRIAFDHSMSQSRPTVLQSEKSLDRFQNCPNQIKTEQKESFL